MTQRLSWKRRIFKTSRLGATAQCPKSRRQAYSRSVRKTPHFFQKTTEPKFRCRVLFCLEMHLMSIYLGRCQRSFDASETDNNSACLTLFSRIISCSKHVETKCWHRCRPSTTFHSIPWRSTVSTISFSMSRGGLLYKPRRGRPCAEGPGRFQEWNHAVNIVITYVVSLLNMPLPQHQKTEVLSWNWGWISWMGEHWWREGGKDCSPNWP